MSLEKALEANTAALEAHTAVLEKLLAGQAKAIAKIDEVTGTEETDRGSRRRGRSEENAEEADTGSRRSRRTAEDDKGEEDRGSRRSRRTAEDDKGEEEPRTSRRGRAAAEKEEKPKKDEKPKKLTLGDVRAAFADYMNVKDEDEEKDRRKFIDSILDHLDVDKTSDIKDADFEAVIGWVEDKAAGRKVRFD